MCLTPPIDYGVELMTSKTLGFTGTFAASDAGPGFVPWKASNDRRQCPRRWRGAVGDDRVQDLLVSLLTTIRTVRGMAASSSHFSRTAPYRPGQS